MFYAPVRPTVDEKTKSVTVGRDEKGVLKYRGEEETVRDLFIQKKYLKLVGHYLNPSSL